MDYRYQIVIGEQMILMRWPLRVSIRSSSSMRWGRNLNKCQTAVDFSIVGDLVPTEDPLEHKKYTIKYLEEAFERGIDNLSEFALWDYKGGRFVTVNGVGKKGL